MATTKIIDNSTRYDQQQAFRSEHAAMAKNIANLRSSSQQLLTGKLKVFKNSGQLDHDIKVRVGAGRKKDLLSIEDSNKFLIDILKGAYGKRYGAENIIKTLENTGDSNTSITIEDFRRAQIELEALPDVAPKPDTHHVKNNQENAQAWVRHFKYQDDPNDFNEITLDATGTDSEEVQKHNGKMWSIDILRSAYRDKNGLESVLAAYANKVENERPKDVATEGKLRAAIEVLELRASQDVQVRIGKGTYFLPERKIASVVMGFDSTPLNKEGDYVGYPDKTAIQDIVLNKGLAESSYKEKSNGFAGRGGQAQVYFLDSYDRTSDEVMRWEGATDSTGKDYFPKLKKEDAEEGDIYAATLKTNSDHHLKATMFYIMTKEGPECEIHRVPPSKVKQFVLDHVDEENGKEAFMIGQRMPKFDGEELGDILKRKTYSADSDAVKAVAKQGVDFIHDLHKKGAVHHDLKPGNMAFDESTLKVSFFDNGMLESNIKTDSNAGTASYRSPETRLRRPHGGEADLYSLGITLLNMTSQGFARETMNLFRNQHRHPPTGGDVNTAAKDAREVNRKKRREEIKNVHKELEDLDGAGRLKYLVENYKKKKPVKGGEFEEMLNKNPDFKKFVETCLGAPKMAAQPKGGNGGIVPEDPFETLKNSKYVK